MDRDAALAAIAAGRVIAILRGDFRENARPVAEALIAGGLRAIEVSLTSPGADAVIARLAADAPADIAIGAGTVRSADDCRRVVDAGACFAISPHTSPSLIAEARRLGLAVIPGAFTPTEIAIAVDAGADAVKLFPAEWMGPARFAALLAPFPGVRFVPTGGVDATLAADYLCRGAWAVGVGSPLMGSDLAAPDGLARLGARARAFAQAAADAARFGVA